MLIAALSRRDCLKKNVFMLLVFFFVNISGASRYFTFQGFNNDGEIYNTFKSSEINSANAYGFITRDNTLTKAFTFELTSSSTYTNLTLLLCEVEAFTGEGIF